MINFRALGGSKLKKLANTPLFRSGELININENDKNFIVDKLLIRSYIDLRTDDEIEKRGKPDCLINAGVEWKSFPIQDNNHYFRTKTEPDYYDYYDSYRCLLELNKIQFRNIFLYLGMIWPARSVFACFAGKDRTGILAILLLLLIGLDEQDIVADYVESTVYLHKKIDFFKDKWLQKGVTKEQYLRRLTPNPNTAFLLIEYVKQTYGNAKGYLEEIGLNESDYCHMLNGLRAFYKLDSE